MGASPIPSGSNSSTYYSQDDPEFISALQNTVLPGDLIPERDTTQSNAISQESSNLSPPPCAQPVLKRRHETPSPQPSYPKLYSQPDGNVDNDDIYGASKFGGYGEYMRRKRAKLQIQNAELDTGQSVDQGTRLFHGLSIYINGWTEPSVQVLRELIVQHGGIFQPYLDRKSIVTHIITSSLTPAKIREFQHMKVVRPEWLVESAKRGVLLPWTDFAFKPGDRIEKVQGTQSTQRKLSILSTFRTHVAPQNSRIDGSPEHNDGASTQMAMSLLGQNDLVSRKEAVKDAIYVKDPTARGDASKVPRYAAHKSNPNASRLLADPAWRAAHTSAAPDFIDGFYQNSRLHHLSTWRAELRRLVAQAQEHAQAREVMVNTEASVDLLDSSIMNANAGTSMKGAEHVLKFPTRAKNKGKRKAQDPEEKVIMHCDFDCFFVSASLLDRPHLRGKPTVVCHSQGAQGGMSSTSEVACASYEARKSGVKNGMSLQQARKLCPGVVTIPYEFEKYKEVSLKFYTILMSHADDVEAVSVDEALIDVTGRVSDMRTGGMELGAEKAFADGLRTEIKEATGCDVSIGVSHNILLARLATRRAKPAGSYHLQLSEVHSFLAPLDIADLPGFGPSAKQKAVEMLQTSKLGELLTKSKAELSTILGTKTGEKLHNAVRGIDDRRLESEKKRSSVSSEITYGIRFDNNEQAEAFIRRMAEEVSKRLKGANMVGRSITLKVMKRDPKAPVEAPKFLGHGACDVFNKQGPLAGPGGHPTSDEHIIGNHAWRLLKSFNFDPQELRGIGIHIHKLESTDLDPPSAVPQDGQISLPFKSGPSPTKAKRKEVDPVQRPEGEPRLMTSNIARELELPSFSQVDKSVFNALPAEVRTELEAEYQRRSTSPFPVGGPANLPPRLVGPAKPKDLRGRFPTTGTRGSLARITQQLAPRNRSSVSYKTYELFAAKPKGVSPSVRVPGEELRSLDIDPAVFAVLPPAVQREQLIMARHVKATGRLPAPPKKRLVLKPVFRPSRSPSSIYRRPLPRARFLPPPFLKQRGPNKGEKLYFTEIDDVQNVIEKWVDRFQGSPPKEKDVEYFSKFLLQSVDGQQSTDVGVEKAVAVLKWWMILLRRTWGAWERSYDVFEMDAGGAAEETVGKAWWRAFWKVKGEMDAITKKRFGGCLSLR